VAVVHSFLTPVSFSDIPTPFPIVPISEQQAAAEEAMKNIAAEFRQRYPALTIHERVVYGDIVDSIAEYAREWSPLLVVIGNDFENGAMWFENSTLSALRNLPYAVLAVPAEATFAPVSNICFAYNYKLPVETAALQQLRNIVSVTNARLDIINVSDEADQSGVITAAVNEVLSSCSPQFHHLRETNVDSAIQNYVLSSHTDWLAVIPHKHSFFERLLHKSHTQSMLHKSRVPLLALHG
jgi:nucleotide-binding universal stress UspA family protein